MEAGCRASVAMKRGVLKGARGELDGCSWPRQEREGERGTKEPAATGQRDSPVLARRKIPASSLWYVLIPLVVLLVARAVAAKEGGVGRTWGCCPGRPSGGQECVHLRLVQSEDNLHELKKRTGKMPVGIAGEGAVPVRR